MCLTASTGTAPWEPRGLQSPRLSIYRPSTISCAVWGLCLGQAAWPGWSLSKHSASCLLEDASTWWSGGGPWVPSTSAAGSDTS